MVVRMRALRLTSILVVVSPLVSGLLGQNDAIPLTIGDSISISIRNDDRWLAASSKRALESGLYGVASEIANEILASGRSIDATIRAELALIRIDSYLGWGKVEDASRLIDNLESSGADDNSVALRKAMLAFACLLYTSDAADE